MTIFDAPDGTRLAQHVLGRGDPLVCLPGGPMLPSSYLGDLGGLSEHRSLVLLDPRGTGDSGAPEDPSTYRCDRQVDDVEALRAKLGRERIDLLAHSAGASLALLYAARHPERIERLVLVTPSPRVVGVEVTDNQRREAAELRRGEPWFQEAFAGFERIWAGEPTDADWDAIAPFSHGHWDETRKALAAQDDRQRNNQAAALYYGDGLPDPVDTRAALAALQAPVLLLTGEVDVALPPGSAAEYAALFPKAELAVQSATGHFPWLDDAGAFVRTVAAFLP